MPQPSMYSSSTSSPCEREQSSSSSSSCRSSSGSSNQSTTNITAFLSKLWRLVDDKAYDDMVCWSESGCSFIIINQTRFAKELLPLYFKHGNMASFIRQLNMYGFRKLSNNCTNDMKKRDQRTISPEMAHFYHVNFMRDNERKIADIKRKSNSFKVAHHLMANGSFCDEVRAMISDVKSIRELQSSILDDMHIEKKTLWREVDLLRARHQKQQKVVERVIQFLTLVSSTDKKIKKEEDCSQSSMSLKRRRQYQQQHKQRQQQQQQQQHQQIVLYLDQAEQQNNKANSSSNTNTFNMSPAYSIESPGSSYINSNNDYSNNVHVNQQQEQTNINVVATTTSPNLVANDASCCCGHCLPPLPLQQYHQQQHQHQHHQQQQQQHQQHQQQQQQQQVQFQHHQHQQQQVQSHMDQMTTNQLNNMTMRFQHQQLFSLDQDDVYSSSFNTSSNTNSSSTDDLVATYWP